MNCFYCIKQKIMPFKIFLFFVFILSLGSLDLFSQGKFAGSFKKLIGRTYSNDRHIPGLEGYDYRQGDLITDVNDEESQFITVFIKGKNAAVVYSAQSGATKKIFTIIDIIQIKNIPPGWEIKTAGCSEGATEPEIIIALVNPGKKQYTTTVKQAWLCERDRLRIEAIGTKNVKCLNEGFGE